MVRPSRVPVMEPSCPMVSSWFAKVRPVRVTPAGRLSVSVRVVQSAPNRTRTFQVREPSVVTMEVVPVFPSPSIFTTLGAL